MSISKLIEKTRLIISYLAFSSFMLVYNPLLALYNILMNEHMKFMFKENISLIKRLNIEGGISFITDYDELSKNHNVKIQFANFKSYMQDEIWQIAYLYKNKINLPEILESDSEFKLDYDERVEIFKNKITNMHGTCNILENHIMPSIIDEDHFKKFTFIYSGYTFNIDLCKFYKKFKNYSFYENIYEIFNKFHKGTIYYKDKDLFNNVHVKNKNLLMKVNDRAIEIFIKRGRYYKNHYFNDFVATVLIITIINVLIFQIKVFLLYF